MNGTTHPLLSLLDHFSSPLAGGGLFIQQSTKSQLPPPNLFHMAPSLSLSLPLTLSRPLSLYSQESGSDIWCRPVPLLITAPVTDMPSHPHKHTHKKKNPSSTSPVLLEECSRPPPPRHSLSPSLGQNNNEPPGPRLNRSRRIMT